MTDRDQPSPHAKTEPRQMAYEIKRREFQAQNGRIIKRMINNRD